MNKKKTYGWKEIDDEKTSEWKKQMNERNKYTKGKQMNEKKNIGTKNRWTKITDERKSIDERKRVDERKKNGWTKRNDRKKQMKEKKKMNEQTCSERVMNELKHMHEKTDAM